MKKALAGSMVMIMTAACGDSGGDGDDGSVASGAGGAGGSAPADPYAEMYECEEVMFGEAKPLSGPGYDPETGFVGTPQATYVIHTTQIYTRPEQESEFMSTAGKVIAQLGSTEGLVAFTLGGDDGCGVSRTMGVWTSEEALYAFVQSGAHLEAMSKTGQLSYTGKTTHWDATPEEVEALTWDVARAKLEDIDPITGYGY
jgi:heme-degrading monooxygenase HmoA